MTLGNEAPRDQAHRQCLPVALYESSLESCKFSQCMPHRHASKQASRAGSPNLDKLECPSPPPSPGGPAFH